MVSEWSSLGTGIPASVVVGIGCISVILGYLSVLDGTVLDRTMTRQSGQVAHPRRRIHRCPVLVDVGHRHQAPIEHLGNPDDYSSQGATHVPSLFRTRAAVSAACDVGARLPVRDRPFRDEATVWSRAAATPQPS